MKMKKIPQMGDGVMGYRIWDMGLGGRMRIRMKGILDF